MGFEIVQPGGHTLELGLNTLYPDSLSVFRRDRQVEYVKVGGGSELRTNGSRGLEILAVGKFAPDERAVLQDIIEDFSSDVSTVTADNRSYGAMILLEGTLSEKSGEVGGVYRLRFGGYEI